MASLDVPNIYKHYLLWRNKKLIKSSGINIPIDGQNYYPHSCMIIPWHPLPMNSMEPPLLVFLWEASPALLRNEPISQSTSTGSSVYGTIMQAHLHISPSLIQSILGYRSCTFQSIKLNHWIWFILYISYNISRKLAMVLKQKINFSL